MVIDPTPDIAGAGPADDLAARAVGLAERWVGESADVEADPAAQRLAQVLRDPDGLPFTIGFVDRVMRPESLRAAAGNLHRIAPLVPEFLPWYLRSAVRVGGSAAPVFPAPIVPVARRALRGMVGHLVVDARPERLGPALSALREGGARLNLNLLGEAVLGDQEAARRLDGIHDLVRRPDVDYVSVKISAIEGRISMWAFDEVVDRVVEKLLPLYLSAAGDATFINLDMEEYRDLDLTIAVFTRLLEDPRLRSLEAGIVLQTYLPDALPALRELTAWARQRVADGGAKIKVRLVKGANLAMERVDAVLHGWSLATYDTKLDADANYLRCLDEALRERNTAAVRIGVAGHNLFDIAYAWLLAGDRGVRSAVDIEMLLGMAQGQMRAVAREVGPVLLYVPVVRPDEFDVAISYLVRRLEENASSENYLSAAFELAEDPALLERERERFLHSVARARESGLAEGARRRAVDDGSLAGSPADLGEPQSAEGVAQTPAPAVGEALTEAVIVIARGGASAGMVEETAVYSSLESDADANGMPGFRNTTDSDPALPATRDWAREIFARIPGSTAGEDTLSAARVSSPTELDGVIARVSRGGATWGALSANERAAVVGRAAAELSARRGQLIEVAASETGKPFSEADVEVSEAIDFAAYYSSAARELDRVSGAVFVPSRVTVVASPWNFPIAIPTGGVLAALAAGSGVVFSPAPQARRCAAVITEALLAAGVPADALALVDLDEGELGRELITHAEIDRVLLTGSWETAALFRSWRPTLPLLAETSGKNAMIIAPSADLDLAAADLVKSAFGHAGQKCSAASLAILVGPVARSKRFLRQVVDATRSLRVGPATDPLTEVGPLIDKPEGKLAWALKELDQGESWLVEPTLLDGPADLAGRLWTPGIRSGVRPGSRFHLEEFFGPVLGIMTARSLEHAIELQNAVDYGLTAGLHTQDPDELELWLASVQAGNLYVNRGTTGAIVQRQPFGGWKRSSVGPGTKAGGPNYLVALGEWRDSAGASSSTLHLRGLDTRITGLIEASQPSLDYRSFDWLRRAALSDAVWWDREFGRVKDASRLGVERNLFRYRPVPVMVRATGDAEWRAVLRVVLAGLRAGSDLVLSVPVGLPAEVWRSLSDFGVTIHVESDDEWIDRMSGDRGDVVNTVEDLGPRAPRVRLLGSQGSVAALHERLSDAVGGDPDLAVYDGEVTTSGRIELLTFIHEQSISITAHRFGNPDPWSASVI